MKVIHGKTCRKVEHSPIQTGYFHDPDDDTSFDVDGVLYCGRCHEYIGLSLYAAK